MSFVSSSVTKRIDTLVLVTNETNQSPHILLGLKKRGFGSGKWNGFGGKVEKNETIEAAAKRELKEECNLDSHRLNKVGVMSFQLPTDPKLLEIHVFATHEYSGEVRESDEMMPKWFPVQDIPYADMWADDILWLPLVLKGSHFRAYFKFSDPNLNSISEYVVQEYENKDCKPLEPIE